METRISVIGGGSWATALVKILTANIDKVCWYMRNEQAIEHIRATKHNPNYLSDVHLNIAKLHLTNSLDEAVAFSDYIILCIPSAFLNDELEKLTLPLSDKNIFSAIKGIEPKSGMIVGEYLQKVHCVPDNQIGVVAGPCHAEEVALERLSYLTIACTDEEKARFVADAMTRPFVKTKISDDVIGIEYGAMLKNIYALAAGIAHGLGYGDNFQSVLMSNAIREMERYIKHIYKIKRNINHSAYLGDLLVTAYSLFSRNRTFGTMIGKGYTVKSTMAEMNMVAEGYYATKSAYNINLNQEKPSRTPILNAVYKVLYENKRAKTVFAELTNELN
ncbi:putative glycerol-3-phosphate dehydrogenase [NAD(P)+ ] [Capnocytophaga sp. oral taxon 332 str. F0381]|uniref:NAD(P)H-dependent glycerol-3-phosphate dehydrogenase n=1 Tax=Capnocytophaga sp. oral taxon 332 TaxID=712213 RepID=UPI0002A2BB2D|nr:NAD(P)H-dependent glycerol-3-phosphate dehydrogenase [Capnocytophaga sp. oral taxon 332]EKY12382.1 putative glycerol-3-phosphate dehydrogenase [NAD(P)+ ] [Capnocytophaga sp. oral taxon 332 str. F0381]